MSISLPHGVRLERGEGGLERVVVETAAGTGEVYLHGGHVTRWRPASGEPVLWMSAASRFEAGKAIRGGVPICFPWFGPKADDPKAPAHGFARTMDWRFDSVRREGDEVTVGLALSADDSSLRLWPHDFALRLEARFGRMLVTTLEVHNRGGDAARVEEALHTYLTVGDVRKVSIMGLAGVEFIDKVDGGRRKRQGSEPITLTSETDRVYLNTRGECVLHDPGMARRIVVEKSGSDSTVVWNPWVAKAKAMSDFGDDEWPGMMCIETANAGENAVMIAPGGRHRITATVRVE